MKINLLDVVQLDGKATPINCGSRRGVAVSDNVIPESVSADVLEFWLSTIRSGLVCSGFHNDALPWKRTRPGPNLLQHQPQGLL
jgi:hypothetical protein